MKRESIAAKVGAGAALVAVPAALTALGLIGIERGLRDGPHPLDGAVGEWVRTRTPEALAPGLEALSRLLGLGGWLVPLVGALLGLAWVLWRRGRRCEAAGLVTAIVMSGTAVGIARRLFERARPAVEGALGAAPGYSFPSGHAASAVVYSGMLTYLAWKLTGRWPPTLAAGALAVLVSLGTGYSRIYLGVHYPSDVLAGYLVGLIWLAAGIATTELLPWLCRRRAEGEGEEESARRRARAAA